MLLSLRKTWKVWIHKCVSSHGPLVQPLPNNIWQRFNSFDLIASKRGCRGGDKRRPKVEKNIPTIGSTFQRNCSKHVLKRTVTRSNLLNIPLQTINSTNNQGSRTTPSKEFVPSILLSNVMSLTPKIDEIRHFVSQDYPNFIFITETWLRESVEDNQVTLPGYNIQRRDRSSGDHGGVCLYLNEGIKFNILRDIEDSNSEVLWVQTRPARLPRGIPCIIAATIYHPPSASNNIMLEYLSKTFDDC